MITCHVIYFGWSHGMPFALLVPEGRTTALVFVLDGDRAVIPLRTLMVIRQGQPSPAKPAFLNYVDPLSSVIWAARHGVQDFMKSWGYYALSVVLALATVPMYRYILARPGRLSSESSSPSSAPSMPVVSSVDCVAGRLYAHMGADSVFALMHDGHFVACDDGLRAASVHIVPMATTGYVIPLPPEDRCYGGFVLRVQHSDFSNIIGLDGRPRRCRGRMAAPDFQ